VAGEDEEITIVTAVGGVVVALNQSSKSFETLFVEKADPLTFWGVDVSHIESITETPFVIHNVGVRVGGVSVMWVSLLSMDSVVVQVGVVWPGWEVKSVSVGEGWVVSSFNWRIIREVWDFTHIVGKTFVVVTSHQLMMMPVVEFTTMFGLVEEFLMRHPPRGQDVLVVVVSVDTNIFSEVSQGLFWMNIDVPAGVVSVDGVSLVVGVLDFMLMLVGTPIVLLVLLGLVDDFVVEEIVWEDFFDWWKDDALGVVAVDDGDAQGVDVHTLIDVLAGPAGDLVEGLVVLSVVQGPEEGDGLFQMFWVEHGENFSLWEDVVLIVLPEVLGILGLGPLVPVSVPFEVVGDLNDLLVVAWLVHIVEEVENVLLLFKENLVGNSFV